MAKGSIGLLGLCASILVGGVPLACGNEAAEHEPNGISGSNTGGGAGTDVAGRSGGAGGTGAGSDTGTCNADLTSDPEHCGACFRTCFGSACVRGVCRPVDVIALSDSPQRMAIGRDHVVWVDGFRSRVGYSRKDGSESDSFIGGASPSNVAATATHVYWTVSEDIPGNPNVVRRRFASSQSEALMSGGSAYELALDQAHVYWFESGGRYRAGSALHDGSDRTIWSDTATGISLWADTERLFWLYLQDVYSCPKTDCSAPTAMGLSLGREWATEPLLAVDDTHLYIADEFGIHRVDKDGGPKETLLTEVATGLALDGSFIYFSISSKGHVARMPKVGGEMRVIVTSQSEPTDVRVDETAVFWLDEGDAVIRKLAKPLP